jgi:lipopolysaccharide transport system ATP-binding protein
MPDTVITVENLSKSYLVGHKSAGQNRRNDTLRDAIGREAHSFARNAVNLIRGRQVLLGDQVEEFWALKDISFEVERGEILGIIGRNGAGKSTLLKILSRITEPTRGRVVIRGRVASLLEVGTGFHQELTGRENIYLNGAILGMTRAEIRSKFDEIVAFAEVEKFLDTPVKRYSSGMYVRLAFAVAAHLEPEILVIDEVLAVGDNEFQKKCLGKMDDVSRREGRTVLFVSHNMSVIGNLCPISMWLDRGSVRHSGRTADVVQSYIAQGIPTGGTVVSLTDLPRHWIEGKELRFRSLEWLCGLPLQHGATVKARITFETYAIVTKIAVSITFCDLMGRRILTYDTNLPAIYQPILPQPGVYFVDFLIHELPLQPDMYLLDIGCRSGDSWILDHISGAVQTEVLAGPTTPNFIAQRSQMPHVRLECTSTWELGGSVTTLTSPEKRLVT